MKKALVDIFFWYKLIILMLKLELYQHQLCLPYSIDPF